VPNSLSALPPRIVGVEPHAKLKFLNPLCDYTPPEHITLLFTDLGILTPAAISDELIKLYL
jgi:translation initiation factor eIF-2B subunit alpha